MKLILILAGFLLTSCASNSTGLYPKVELEESYIRDIVHELSVNIGPRNMDHKDALSSASSYIQDQFNRLGYTVQLQKFLVHGEEVENIIVSLGPENANRIIVGAHYDTYGDQAGADDNASGVAGLLALAKLLKRHENELEKRIDLVAYTLEEPPFFRTELMGSHVHAKSLKDANVDVDAMISLEMIGYYSSAEDSQDYPTGLLHLFYPDRGDFIGIVSNISSGGLRSALKDHMSKSAIDVQTLSAPAWLVGVDFSDHLNYWKFGYDAVMVTDTAFYRNSNYHKLTDTIQTLDFQKMSQAIQAIYFGVLNLSILLPVDER